MSLINKRVKINKKVNGKILFTGDVQIIDKVLTDKATYENSPIMNNASTEVYIGIVHRVYESITKKEIVAFQYSDIVEVVN